MNIRTLFAATAVATALPMGASALTFFDPVTGTVPQTITALGMYTNMSSKTTDPALKYFEVNTALWSDNAAKGRWIALPTGTSIVYNDTTDAFDYPEGAMFVKNFYLDSVLGDASTRRYWETRVLVNKHNNGLDEWHGFSYRWNKAQNEAHLVSILNGFDTTFIFQPGPSRPQTYNKWRFPSQEQCIECHKKGSNDLGNGVYSARGVLGFLPPQLKRAAPLQPTVNQIVWLADQGIFAKPLPANINYGARWKGLSEPIPTGLTPDQRFKVIDSMARSYIAANCSGCHSQRNASITGNPPEVLNYDFHTLKPKVEFGTNIFPTLEIATPQPLTGPLPDLDLVNDHRKYVEMVKRAGMSDNPFWSSMSLPSSYADGVPTLIQRGSPAASILLYRQFGMRRPAWRDSLSLQFSLANEGDPTNLKAWIFVNPWGSAAWRADLATRGINLDSLLTAKGLWKRDNPNSMPTLATNMPDTAAMRVLGEWATNYCTIVPVEGQGNISCVTGVNIPTGNIVAQAAMPQLRNRMLIVPTGWSGKAQMFSVSGRAYNLPSVGRGQYAIPQAAPVGVYLFRVGDRSFRASVLR